MPITKERNLLHLTVATVHGNKTYTMDINTGVMVNGQNKTLATTPVGLPTLLTQSYNQSNVLRVWYHLHDLYGNWLECVQYDLPLIALADRLDAINCPLSAYQLRTYRKHLTEHFAEFARYWANLDKQENDIGDNYLTQWWEENQKTLWIASHGLTVDDHLTQPIVDYLYELAKSRGVNDEHIKMYAYYLTRGLYEYSLTTDWWGQLVLENNLTYKILTMEKMCRALNIHPTKNNFIQEYAKMSVDYRAWQNKESEQKFAELYNRHAKAFNFRAYGLIVKIPTCNDDFINEGRNQHNCVGGYVDKVLRGESYVVFIRKESDPDTSYITCEIRKGQIGQFLTTYNHTANDDTALQFKAEFTKHLMENW